LHSFLNLALRGGECACRHPTFLAEVDQSGAPSEAASLGTLRRPQRMGANAMMPVGAEEYDTAVMEAS